MQELGRTIVAVVFLVVAWGVTYVWLHHRTKRERHRADMHARLLERVGSARELGEFLTTPVGERFLKAMEPAPPTNRISMIRVLNRLVLWK